MQNWGHPDCQTENSAVEIPLRDWSPKSAQLSQPTSIPQVPHCGNLVVCLLDPSSALSSPSRLAAARYCQLFQSTARRLDPSSRGHFLFLPGSATNLCSNVSCLTTPPIGIDAFFICLIFCHSKHLLLLSALFVCLSFIWSVYLPSSNDMPPLA